MGIDTQKNSAVVTLKEVLAIVTGLTITNGLIVLVTGGGYDVIRTPSEFDLVTLALFGILVLNLARFYLGNVRLLDDCYLASYGRQTTGGTERIQNLALDYWVVLITGILLASLSFYLGDPPTFFLIFSVILLVDILWFVITWKDSQDLGVRTQRRWWTINNVGFVLFVAYGATVPPTTESRLWVAPFAAVLANTVLDYTLSWRFYFFTHPSVSRLTPKVFVAAPFTQTINPETGFVDSEYRLKLEPVLEALRSAGYEIFSAHDRENWGEALEDPATALRRDLNELSDADIVVAFVGSPPSPGVQMELGAAAIMGKPVIFLVEDGAASPYLLDGLPTVTTGIRINYHSGADAAQKVLAALSNVRASKWIR